MRLTKCEIVNIKENKQLAYPPLPPFNFVDSTIWTVCEVGMSQIQKQVFNFLYYKVLLSVWHTPTINYRCQTSCTYSKYHVTHADSLTTCAHVARTGVIKILLDVIERSFCWIVCKLFCTSSSDHYGSKKHRLTL